MRRLPAFSQMAAGELDYLDALSDLVESYEEANINIPDASEAEVLNEQHGLSQWKLAKAVGISQSTISSELMADSVRPEGLRLNC